MVDASGIARPKIVGARVQRREDPRLLTGRGHYVDDRRIDGTVHVAFRRSDRAHARIRRIDVAEARQAPGVLGVFVAEDIDAIAGPIRATSNMPDYRATEFVPLARSKVRYVGEPVVAVVAENRYLAEDAGGLISLDLDPLPDVANPEAALEDRTLLHEEAGTNIIAAREFVRGDPEAALADAAVVVEDRFRIRRKTPAAVENRCYLAEFDAGRRALTLHASTQVPGLLRDALAEIFDMPGHRLRVVAPDVGGGFGGKASLYPEEVVVCALAMRLGRPVKWTSDRMEDLTATSQAFDEIVHARLGLASDGRIVALDADVIGDIGAYSIYPWTASLEPVQVVSFLPGPYRVQNYRGRVRAVATSKAPTGPYRGVGRPISTFVMERLIDMAAKRLGLDPAEIRALNLVRDDEFPYKSGSGIIWDRSGFQECLRAALDRFGYPQRRAEQAAARGTGKLVGIGIASYAELTGIGSRISAAPGMPINTGTERATINIDSTGAVTAAFGIASHGQGLETTLAQIVAEELGARVEDVEIVHGDSNAVAHSTGTYASRSTVLAGGAATLSARALRKHVIEAASYLLEAAEADIEVQDGVISVAGTDSSITFRELARAFYTEMRRIPREARESLDLTASATYDPFFRHDDSGHAYRRGRNRSADLRGDGAQLRRGRRLRPHRQSDDRGRAGPWRRCAGHRRGAVRRGRPRRERPDPDGQLRRLYCPVCGRDSRYGGGSSRDRIAVDPGRIPGHGRGRHDRCAGRRRQRRRRRPGGHGHPNQRAADHAGTAFPADPQCQSKQERARK